MDSKSDQTQPLLVDLEGGESGPTNATAAVDSHPQHLCTRCARELSALPGHEHPKQITLRGVIIFGAIVLCIVIFILAVLTMVVSFYLSQLVAALWADVTIAVLVILLWAGRRRSHRLGRTTTQIIILCTMAVSWIIVNVGLSIQNGRACRYYVCGEFTMVHVFSWILVFTLLAVAYASYRQAIEAHGIELVPNPNMIPAWRLSDVANRGGVGGIKI